jgi:hypothetical protein
MSSSIRVETDSHQDDHGSHGSSIMTPCCCSNSIPSRTVRSTTAELAIESSIQASFAEKTALEMKELVDFWKAKLTSPTRMATCHMPHNSLTALAEEDEETSSGRRNVMTLLLLTAVATIMARTTKMSWLPRPTSARSTSRSMHLKYLLVTCSVRANLEATLGICLVSPTVWPKTMTIMPNSPFPFTAIKETSNFATVLLPLPLRHTRRALTHAILRLANRALLHVVVTTSLRFYFRSLLVLLHVLLPMFRWMTFTR